MGSEQHVHMQVLFGKKGPLLFQFEDTPVCLASGPDKIVPRGTGSTKGKKGPIMTFPPCPTWDGL